MYVYRYVAKQTIKVCSGSTTENWLLTEGISYIQF